MAVVRMWQEIRLEMPRGGPIEPEKLSGLNPEGKGKLGKVW